MCPPCPSAPRVRWICASATVQLDARRKTDATCPNTCIARGPPAKKRARCPLRRLGGTPPILELLLDRLLDLLLQPPLRPTPAQLELGRRECSRAGGWQSPQAAAPVLASFLAAAARNLSSRVVVHFSTPWHQCLHFINMAAHGPAAGLRARGERRESEDHRIADAPRLPCTMDCACVLHSHPRTLGPCGDSGGVVGVLHEHMLGSLSLDAAMGMARCTPSQSFLSTALRCAANR